MVSFSILTRELNMDDRFPMSPPPEGEHSHQPATSSAPSFLAARALAQRGDRQHRDRRCSRCMLACRSHHPPRVVLRQCRSGLAGLVRHRRGDQVLVRERLAREPRAIRTSRQRPEGSARTLAHGGAAADVDRGGFGGACESTRMGRPAQVVGNVVSEWSQILSLVWFTKCIIERGSKQSHG